MNILPNKEEDTAPISKRMGFLAGSMLMSMLLLQILLLGR